LQSLNKLLLISWLYPPLSDIAAQYVPKVLETTTPRVKSEAAASKMVGSSGSKCWRIGAVANAVWSLTKASCVSAVHWNLRMFSFFSRFVRGQVILLKFLINRQ
jgi:hypothetical protein